MAKRHFLMLAHTYVPGAPIGGWYASEKLDGMRAFWDGGITRGIPTSGVAFANVSKDARYKVQPTATGLWSRYGKSIQAPDWFLDSLPKTPLDGELYAGRGQFQFLMSTVKDLVPGAGWDKVQYRAFDSPPYHIVFGDGEINETNFKKKFVHLQSKLKWGQQSLTGMPQFRQVYHYMGELEQNDHFVVHVQHLLHPFTSQAVPQMEQLLETVISGGGEGLILRSPTSNWLPNRVRTLLKVKALNDAEGVVTGYVSGRETELGSKLLGLMGALVVNYNGKRLELSGFTDHERCLAGSAGGTSGTRYAMDHPGVQLPDGIVNPLFPIGSKITFRYRELSDDGIPKEARYWRKRDDES